MARKIDFFNKWVESPIYVIESDWGSSSQIDSFISNSNWKPSSSDNAGIEYIRDTKIGDIVILKKHNSGNQYEILAGGIVLNKSVTEIELTVSWLKIYFRIQTNYSRYYKQNFAKLNRSAKEELYDLGVKNKKISDFLLNLIILKEDFISNLSDGNIESITNNENKIDDIENSITRKFTSLPFNSDSPKNYLQVEQIAAAYAEVIHTSSVSKSKTSQEDRFFGIFGRWGRGKTHLWEEIKKYLKGKYPDNYRYVNFHAWKYQDTPAVWAYLYETIAKQYYFKFKHFLLFPFEVVINWIMSFWLSIFRKPVYVYLVMAGLSLTSLYSRFLPNNFSEIDLTIFQWQPAFGIIGISTLLFSLIKTFKKPLVSEAKNFIKEVSRKSFKIHLGVQHEIQTELRALLKAWTILDGPEKIILFVDDIDRCSHEKIIDIVDSIRVMLNDDIIRQKLIVVAAIDERILGAAIRMKYEKMNIYLPDDN